MRDGRHDFDFLFGTWRVHNRRLLRRLEGGTEWEAFESDAEARPILHGAGNVDRFSTDHGGTPWEGVTMRLFDPATGDWTIHWTSTARLGHFDPPMVGRFRDGVGEFHGEDTFAGRPIRVRFFWKDITGTSAVWEQAFSADGGAGWETNWVMTFARR